MRIESNDKIKIYDDLFISAASGSVGYVQRLNHHIAEAVRGGVFRGKQKVNEATGNISKRFISDLQNSMSFRHPQHGIGFHALLAAVINGEAYLAEYDGQNFQPEIKEERLFYVSIGSGQNLADPFLAFVSKVLWHDTMPTVDVAKFGVLWTLQHTIRLAAMGVGGTPLLAIMRKDGENWGSRYVSADDMQEGFQYTAELEKYIGDFALAAIGRADAPEPPAPPAVQA